MQPQQMMIDPSLQNELKSGEQVLWWGRCDPKRRARATNTYIAYYILYGVLCVAFFFLLFSVIQLAQSENTYLSGISSSTIALLVGTFILFGVMLYRISLTYRQQARQTTDLRNTTYGITNRRVIVMIARKQGPTVHSFTQSDIGQINRVETGAGWGDVAFGKVRQIQRGMRMLTVTEKLQGIPNARMVEDILARTFKNMDAGWSQEYMPQPQMQPYYPPMLTQYPAQQPASPASQPQE